MNCEVNIRYEVDEKKQKIEQEKIPVAQDALSYATTTVMTCNATMLYAAT